MQGSSPCIGCNRYGGHLRGQLNILVTGEGASASKVSKAKNATIYTEAEYNDLIGN